MEEKIVSIDIVSDIIKAAYTGGRYKGKEVEKILLDSIAKLNPSSLLIIDILKANPLDYVFCQYAFGSVLQMIQENNKPTLFKMQPLHMRCFYRGILKHIDKGLPRNTQIEESKKIFFETGFFTMIKTVDENIEFIGNLNSDDKSILNFINTKHKVSERDIIDVEKNLQPTQIIESLKSLNMKGFILSPMNGSDKYCSVYEYLKPKNNEN